MKISKKALVSLIREEVDSIYAGTDEQESVFKEREMTHEVDKTLGEISRYIEKAQSAVEHPTDMDTIEITVSQLKNWENVLTKFLMAIGG